MGNKKAIMVVSFGTSCPSSLARTIDAIEKIVKKTFPEYSVYQAFTSQKIIDRLKKTENIYINSVEEALNSMIADGVESVIIQSTNIINGTEHDKMLGVLENYRDSFKRIRTGKPLLSSADDYKKTIHALMSEIRYGEDEILVLMGHGADHHAASAYPALEYTFHLLGYDRVLVGVIEGFPDVNNVIAKLEISNIKKVVLMPLLLVAGGHVRKNMIGEKDSWLIKLEESGYEVKTIIKGLGEIEGIQNIFLEHIETAK